MDVLTKGILPSFWGLPTDIRADQPAILQVYHVKPMVPKGADPGAEVERWRVILCDGIYFAQSMIGSNLKHLMNNGSLQRQSIVQVDSAQANSVNGKRLLIVADMKVLGEYGQPDKVNESPISIDSYEEQTGHQKAEQPQGISGNNFYGQQKTNQTMPPPAAPNNQTNRVHDSHQANIYPIGSLSPYAHKWTIKARVTSKSEIRSWHKQNAQGGTNEGSLFSVVFLDESGEIRATAFSSAGNCFHEWYDLLQEGGVYYISNPCKVGLAKKAFNQGVKNDYELTFERETRIEKSQDAGSIPSIVYNFTTIEGLQQVEPNTIIDTIGVLKAVGDAETITSKSSHKPFTKRELTIADDTHHEVRLTIWGDQAQKFNAEPESVMAFKGVKVSDFGGRSLSLTSGGSMKINPDIKEAHDLKGWYDAQGRNEKFQTHVGLNSRAGGGKTNEWKTCIQVKDEHLGLSDTPDYFSVKATVQFISHGSPQATSSSMYYPACRSENCNKKVSESDTNPGEWRCEACNKVWDHPEYRYILRVCVVDHTGSLWLNLFDKDARILFGKSADELHAMEDDMNRDTFKFEVDSLGLWKTWNFNCRAKLDTYGDQQRVRYTVSNLAPVDFAVESKKLADKLKEFGLNSEENSLFV